MLDGGIKYFLATIGVRLNDPMNGKVIAFGRPGGEKEVMGLLHA